MKNNALKREPKNKSRLFKIQLPYFVGSIVVTTVVLL